MLNKYKKGDKVIVTKLCAGDSDEGVKVGDCGIIFGSPQEKGVTVQMIEGKASGKEIGMLWEQMEAYIYPAFKVGHKFKFGNDELEVVAVKFNKKLKKYCYLIYRISDGYIGALLESDIPEKAVKMTLTQVQKALGKKVEIINNNGKPLK